MDEKDFRNFEQMLATVVDSRLEQFRDEIGEDFRHQVGILSENFQHKLDIVVEGQQMLSERMDRMEERLDKRIDQVEKRLDLVESNLTKKIDAVAADLAAHRKGTEAHHGVYWVKEKYGEAATE